VQGAGCAVWSRCSSVAPRMALLHREPLEDLGVPQAPHTAHSVRRTTLEEEGCQDTPGTMAPHGRAARNPRVCLPVPCLVQHCAEAARALAHQQEQLPPVLEAGASKAPPGPLRTVGEVVPARQVSS